MGKLLSGPTTLSIFLRKESLAKVALPQSLLFSRLKKPFPQPLPKHQVLQLPTLWQPSTELAPVYQHLSQVQGPQTWIQISRSDPRNSKQSRSSTSLHLAAMFLFYNPTCCWPPGPPRHTASSCSASLRTFPNFYGLSKVTASGLAMAQASSHTTDR